MERTHSQNKTCNLEAKINDVVPKILQEECRTRWNAVFKKRVGSDEQGNEKQT